MKTVIQILFTLALTAMMLMSGYQEAHGQDIAEYPTFDPGAGTYTEEVDVSLSSDTESAVIYYTLDGSDPDDQSTEYTDPLTISETTTIKAVAYAEGYGISEVSTADYVIDADAVEEEEGPVSENWERSLVNENLPNWFGSGTERSLAYYDDRIYVMSRARDTLSVHRLNARTGADVSLNVVSTTGIEGGTFPLNAIGVTEDGVTYGANLKTADDSHFKVYRWDTLGNPHVYIDYEVPEDDRLGDKLTVVGNEADSSFAIYAASSNSSRVYRWDAFTEADEPVVITLSDDPSADADIFSASVAPLPRGDFYWNAGSAQPRKYEADGTLIGEIGSGVIGGASNAIAYIGREGDDEYLVTLAPGEGRGHGNIIVVEQGNPETAYSLGTTANLHEVGSDNVGDVAVQRNDDGTASVFVLYTNNGLGGYGIEDVTFEFPVFEARDPDEGDQNGDDPIEEEDYWVNLQSPGFAEIDEGDTLTVTAHVSAEGLTEGDDASEEISAWIGYSAGNSDPSGEDWTWVEAEFSGSQEGGHEYLAHIGYDLEVGDYYYASRIQVSGGDYFYGGFAADGDGGIWDGEDNVSGELTVNMATSMHEDRPVAYSISQNYPNPFNPTTQISYTIPEASNVEINVYTLTGQRVATLVNSQMSAGSHTVTFDAQNFASGVYMYRIQAGDFVQTRKMTLIK